MHPFIRDTGDTRVEGLEWRHGCLTHGLCNCEQADDLPGALLSWSIRTACCMQPRGHCDAGHPEPRCHFS